ncbi:IS3 family transposase [Oerskovia turbata]
MEALTNVELAVAEYIDWFNHRRLHGEFGLVPPAELEDQFWQHPYAPDNPVELTAGAR